MTLFLNLLLGFWVLFGIFMTSIIIRNHKVANLRRDIIEKIFRFEDWDWRRHIYMSISYDEMLYKFWKPLTIKSFYGDDDFVK